MNAFLFDLVKLTLNDAGAAARRVMGLRLRTETLWLAVVLVAVMNALFLSASFALMPPPAEMAAAMPAILKSPALVAMFVAGWLVITVFMFTWVGRAIGGQGQLPDVLAVMVWLQLVALLAQVAVTLLVLALPPVGGMASLIANVWGLYLLVVFLTEAHRFGTVFKAIGVIFMSVSLMLAGFVFFLLLIGAAANGGLPANV